ncbi:protein adenylyltransferase SelO [Paraclostridium bifermentans]|uniref:protein adenylyltransferase SelO n=1 Tax=Paraclostridium bifermentans TaxID=1490 RepID=UPI00115BD596|nr:YdiU family protein [Paraclostridium bifermentans]TQO56605.1 YdiU family protein [Paraclostridium bifermentans]
MENNKKNIETGWNLNNSYMNLPDFFYSKINLNPVPSPSLVILNDSLAKFLGLNIDSLKSKDGIELLSGNKKIDEGAFIAQAYAGHQFGHFTMLGDGRALLIGEQINPSGNRFDIQLKGSGKTPYSRGGDGRAVLGPMLREYIISEAMYGLGVPTTRSLAVIKTGESVIRENIKKGAILTRVASSHIRFGTFEYALNYGGVKSVKELADYTINRHYSHIKDDEDKYINLLKEVINAHAKLVAKWQSIGFIHGVMNTDNMTISGESIDYGPCAFMDNYKPDTVFSSIDRYGRYSYENQPNMAEWNLCRFAETLLPLISDDKNEAIKIAQDAISDFSEIYYLNWIKNMRFKLGLFDEELQDKALIEDLLSMMEKYREDFTNTFIALTFNNINKKGMFDSEEFKSWYSLWNERLKRQENSQDEVFKLMKKSNPAVIPRNHRVEEALEAADKGDFNFFKKLITVLEKPYEHSKEQEEYAKLPKPSSCAYRTYCGT